MGTRTLLDMKLDVSRAVNQFGQFSDTRLTRYINEAQDQIAKKWNWKELVMLDDATHTIASVPTTDQFFALSNFLSGSERLKKILSIHVTTDGYERKLFQISPRQFDQDYEQTPTTGSGGDDQTASAPSVFTQRDQEIQLRGIPSGNQTYVMRWRKLPAQLASDTAVSDLDFKDNWIVALAILSGLGSGPVDVKDAEGVKAWREMRAEWKATASALMAEAIIDADTESDVDYLPHAGPNSARINEWWKDPFVRSDPR